MDSTQSKNAYQVLIALFVCTVTMMNSNTIARGPGGWGKTSIGVRLGWSGGPNGFTLRRSLGGGQAFEFVAGYNGKYGRTLEGVPQSRKGNSFIGASYQPTFMMSEGNLGVGLYGDFGARMRYHHYRQLSAPQYGWKITPEVTAGAGMLLEFNEKVELFADVHVLYFNRMDNVYVPGVESGLGLRISLN